MKLLLLILSLWLPLNAFCQEAKKEERTNWWGDTAGMLDMQAEKTFELINNVLDETPPRIPEPLNRRLALLSLDNLLHDEKGDDRSSLHRFFINRIAKAAEEISTTSVKNGARIWKLYNHGFIVKTRSVTIGFDIVGASSARITGFEVPDSILEKIIHECDVIFVSHYHRDHADFNVAEVALRLGKKVVVPPKLWEDLSVTYLARHPTSSQYLDIKNGKELKVITWPGHQGPVLHNNIYIVTTPEGLTFAHTGDQSNAKDLLAIREIRKTVKTDVLFVNCWTPQIGELLKGFNPRLIITGHENELGHTIDHREPYWLTYERLKGVSYQHVLMTWGEVFPYRKSFRKHLR